MTRWMYKLSANKSYHWFDTFLKNVLDGLRFQSQTGLHVQIYHPNSLYCTWLLYKVWEERQSDPPLLSGCRIRRIWYRQGKSISMHWLTVNTTCKTLTFLQLPFIASVCIKIAWGIFVHKVQGHCMVHTMKKIWKSFY